MSIWNGRVAIGYWIEPDLVAACGLAVKFEAESLENGDDIAIAKT